MTIDELKEDVAYHCKSVHPRDNTAQTRIAKILPELFALWETLQRYEDEVDLPDGLAIPLRALNDKAASL